MAGAVRITNGTAVQVRVGVLQGVGPTGPRGIQGERGPEGEQGAQGDTGPQGGIINYMAAAAIGTANTIAASTDVNVSFDSNTFDDFGAYAATVYTLVSPGDYMISAWLDYTPNGTAAGSRQMWFTAAGTTIAKKSVVALASSSIHTWVDLAWAVRISGSTAVRVFTRTTDTVSTTISAGGVTINRIGSGSAGPTGPQGATGPVGPAGPQGPKGDTGSASSGFSRYDDLW